MALILSQNYLGAGSTAIQLANGDTRIYYQATDGAIHEAGGNGSVTSPPLGESCWNLSVSELGSYAPACVFVIDGGHSLTFRVRVLQ